VVAADDGDQFIAFDNIAQANYEPDFAGQPMGRQ